MKKSMPFLLVAYTIITIIVRSPVLLITPRFWAEEGLQYFAYAYKHSFMENLFKQFYGYYTLIPNVSASLATCIPLEYAPLLTTCIARLIQVLGCGVLIVGKSFYWDNTLKKLYVITMLLLLSPAETWAQTIHSMFWLSFGTLFILLERTEGIDTHLKWFYRFILGISGLTGVVSCFMAPIYYIKSYRSKSKEDYLHSLILSFCLLLQTICFTAAVVSHNSTLSGRFSSEGCGLPPNLLRFFVWPFIGEVRNSGFDNSTNTALNIIVLILFIIYFLFALFNGCKIHTIQYIAATFAIVVILSVALSVKSTPLPTGDRYTLLPSYCLFMLIYHSALNKLRFMYFRYASVILLSIIAVHTIHNYRSSMASFTDPTWPVWKDEVMIWKNNHTHEIRIWPQWDGGRWTVKLHGK